MIYPHTPATELTARQLMLKDIYCALIANHVITTNYGFPEILKMANDETDKLIELFNRTK